MEGLDMNIRVDEEGVLWVDKQSFEPIEIARELKSLASSKGNSSQPFSLPAVRCQAPFIVALEDFLYLES